MAFVDHGAGKGDNWEFEVGFCPGSQRSRQESRRGQGKELHTDKLHLVFFGDLADKRIDWMAGGLINGMWAGKL